MSQPATPLLFSVIDYRRTGNRWGYVLLNVAAFTQEQAAATLRAQLPNWHFGHAFITTQWAADMGAGVQVNSGCSEEPITDAQYRAWVNAQTTSCDGAPAAWQRLPEAKAVQA